MFIVEWNQRCYWRTTLAPDVSNTLDSICSNPSNSSPRHQRTFHEECNSQWSFLLIYTKDHSTCLLQGRKWSDPIWEKQVDGGVHRGFQLLTGIRLSVVPCLLSVTPRDRFIFLFGSHLERLPSSLMSLHKPRLYYLARWGFPFQNCIKKR